MNACKTHNSISSEMRPFCIASHYAKLDAVDAISVVANVSYDSRHQA